MASRFIRSNTKSHGTLRPGWPQSDAVPVWGGGAEQYNRRSNSRGDGKLFSFSIMDKNGDDIRGTFFNEGVDRFHPDQGGPDALEKGSVYTFQGGRVKVEIGLGRGKRQADKRQDVKARDAQRDIDRAMKH